MEIDNYLKNGFCVVNDFISPPSAERLYAKILEYSGYRVNTNDIFCYPESLLRFFDPRFYKNQNFCLNGIGLGIDLLNVRKNNRMKEIELKLKLNKCTRIDSYISDISNEDIIQWHCDQSFGGATDPGIYFNGNKADISTQGINKFFLHLTNVKSGDGAFSYLPKSQTVGIAIRKAINSSKIKYEPFMNLKDAYSIINKYYNIFIVEKLLSTEDVDYFLEIAKKALSKTHDFSLNIDAGGMVIFNDLGYHQGTAPSVSQRLVVRYFY